MADAITELLHNFPTISAVVCHNSTVAMGAWFGLTRAGWQMGGGSVDSYYDRHIALAGFAEVTEDDLDDVPMTWVTTPGERNCRSAAQRILQRAQESDVVFSNQIMPARLITIKN